MRIYIFMLLIIILHCSNYFCSNIVNITFLIKSQTQSTHTNKRLRGAQHIVRESAEAWSVCAPGVCVGGPSDGELCLSVVCVVRTPPAQSKQRA